jgi:hypothetical protein
VSELEQEYKPWLNSKLFEGGLQVIEGDWLAKKEHRFLKDLIRNETPASDVSQLLDWMFQQMVRPLAKKGGSAGSFAAFRRLGAAPCLGKSCSVCTIPS